MATIANWNGHTFEVSPSLIRGFTDMTIKGACETTDKNSDKQKYVERKYGEIPEISMTVGLNAQTGVTNVFKEALEFVQEATEGATAYFYMGSSKLLPAKMMLTQAEVVEIVHMPGQGAKWISCNVKLTFKQGTKNDSGSGTGGGSSGTGGTQKATVKTSTLTSLVTTVVEGAKSAITTGINFVAGLIDKAKEASKQKTTGGLAYQTGLVDKATTTQTDSSKKTTPTTSKNCEITLKKITRVPNKPGIDAVSVK